MNLESSLQMGFEWSRNRLFHLLKAIEGQKLRLTQFDKEAVPDEVWDGGLRQQELEGS